MWLTYIKYYFSNYQHFIRRSNRKRTVSTNGEVFHIFIRKCTVIAISLPQSPSILLKLKCLHEDDNGFNKELSDWNKQQWPDRRVEDVWDTS